MQSAGNGAAWGRRLCGLDQRPWEPAFGAYSWTYDGVGNRTQQVLGSATNVYSLPIGSNRLTTVTQGATTLRSFLYDANGNILNDTRSGVLTAYTYNQNNRLKTVTNAGNLNATYTYNAQEQLAVRVLTNMTPSGTIHDVYDRAGNLLMARAFLRGSQNSNHFSHMHPAEAVLLPCRLKTRPLSRHPLRENHARLLEMQHDLSAVNTKTLAPDQSRANR